MNIRKDIDYSEMYAELDKAMAADITQMELYCEIGKAVCRRTEKGAAVAAAAYLSRQYPDAQGFSPRNLRRMRDFYRSYQDYPALLSLAMELGWTQNVVILESGLSTERREWYLKAAMQFGWSKVELQVNISSGLHEKIVLDFDQKVCDNEAVRNDYSVTYRGCSFAQTLIFHLHSYWERSKRTISYSVFTNRPIAFMRC